MNVTPLYETKTPFRILLQFLHSIKWK